jgi:apolipoprotein N-acyltransferase
MLALSAVLYALAFPNPAAPRGFPPAMWAAYLPLFIVTGRAGWKYQGLFGVVFGALSITLHNYWLSAFHPLAGVIAALLFALYYALFFHVLKAAALLLPRACALVQTGLFAGFEYLRTLGFAGYSYGITGYSQWTLPPLIQAASVAGVWAVSALVIFPQAYIAQLIIRKKLTVAPLALWALCFGAAMVYAAFTLQDNDKSGARLVKVALIQPSSNPWKSDLAEFRKELEVLKRLSDMALSEEPPPEIVVWPETAFVPSFAYHEKYRVDADVYALVREAREYLASKKETAFVLGNNEGVRVAGPDGKEETLSYNAVLTFEDGRFTGRYYKQHLVPFTETFPFKEELPRMYDFLSKQDTHFWEKGNEASVLSAADVRICTPVCFEDTFGGEARLFVLRGAQLIVNVSNDSWAHSLTAQRQHLMCAVLRAVETGRGVVRATASGQTCAILPSGVILNEAPPFTETVLSAVLPVSDAETLYTRFGDYLPKLLLILSGLTLAAALIRNLTKQK